MSNCIVSSLLFHFFLSRFSNGIFGLCSDQSAFKDVFGVAGDGFRQYSAYATFVYSQLSSILPTSFLGDISNWDKFLSIDLTSADLPLKGPTEFLRDKDRRDPYSHTICRASGLFLQTLLQSPFETQHPKVKTHTRYVNF